MVHRIVNYGKNFALNDGSNLSLFLFCCRDLARSVYEQHCARQKKSDDDTLTLQGLMRWIVCSLYVDEAIPRGGVLQWKLGLCTLGVRPAIVCVTLSDQRARVCVCSL